MRQQQVAQLAGVSPAAVQQVDVEQVRQALADRVPAIVPTQEEATYWRVGEDYYLDDPYFGPVVKLSDLDYDSEIGLHPRGA